MTHLPEWPIGEPCPVCGSPGILECEPRIGADKIEMGWECGECGHSVTWTAHPDIDEGHIIERRIVEHMPLHAITALYGERGLRERFEEFHGAVSLDRRAPRGCILRAALPESSLAC